MPLSSQSSGSEIDYAPVGGKQISGSDGSGFCDLRSDSPRFRGAMS